MRERLKWVTDRFLGFIIMKGTTFMVSYVAESVKS